MPKGAIKLKKILNMNELECFWGKIKLWKSLEKKQLNGNFPFTPLGESKYRFFPALRFFFFCNLKASSTMCWTENWIVFVQVYIFFSLHECEKLLQVKWKEIYQWKERSPTVLQRSSFKRRGKIRLLLIGQQ